MSRRPRELSPTGIYHIILRGINRQSIFEEEEDKQKLIETIARYREKSGYRIFAYCLMDNHIHLLLQEHKEPIGIGIKRISSSYVYWFNNKYERCGHLFQDRFRSEVVDSDRYFLAVIRYIHQNPMKAKIVKDISEYKWSSYREYLHSGCIIDTDYALNMFSDTSEIALQKFEEFNKQRNDEVCLEVEEDKPIVNDEELKKMIRENFAIDAIRIITEENIRQKEILRELKHLEGVSIRQIARITGVSQTRVWRA